MARSGTTHGDRERASRRAKVGPPESSAQPAAGEVAEPSTAAQLVVISGLSGAGKSQASKLFEDLGYYCVDNLPPELLDGFLALRDADPARYHHVALVLDIRAGDPAPAIKEARAALAAAGRPCRSSTWRPATRPWSAASARRATATRSRRAAACRPGSPRSAGAWPRTRELADHVIDTSGLSIGQLKERLFALLPRDAQADELLIDIITFGFKYGIPLEADLVFDVRFLTNPYWVPDLKPLSGLQAPVRDFVHEAAGRRALPGPGGRAAGADRARLPRRGQSAAHRGARLHRRLSPLDRPGRGAGRAAAKPDQGTSVAVFHRELER